MPAGGAGRDVGLLRRHEPVVRFTRGELFLPMAVEDYLARAALCRRVGKATEQLVPAGELDLARLAACGRVHHGQELFLRFVAAPLGRAAYKQWRQRPGRERFVPSSGAAAVGLLARLVAAAIRLSLLLRGRVPGGWAAAAEQQVADRAVERRCAYYGHVSRDAGYVVCQYWFFYAMNDWRSTFGGVNDHEGDWEQVTVFAVERPDGTTVPAWVAFSSHDETGADLRRRCDDPDLEWVEGHPVVYAGAGSHSGACLPGDYLVTVTPDLPAWLHALRRAFARLFRRPDPEAVGMGIPYLDYHRGDGVTVGPGQQHEWTPVLIEDSTPWVRDYRGLWGLDTRDPLGGERAPAGPRYERDGRVRASWAQPVAWAALDSEPTTEADAAALVEGRRGGLTAEIAAVQAQLTLARGRLRSARAVDRALRRSPLAADTEAAALSARVAQLRARQVTLHRRLDEADAALHAPPVRDDPHAHLRRRALPLERTPARWDRLVRVWAAASASILLAALGALLLVGGSGLLVPSLLIVVAMIVVDALLRGRLVPLLLGAAAVAATVAIVWEAVTLAVGNVRVGVGALLVAAAAYMAWQTLAETLRRR